MKAAELEAAIELVHQQKMHAEALDLLKSGGKLRVTIEGPRGQTVAIKIRGEELPSRIFTNVENGLREIEAEIRALGIEID